MALPLNEAGLDTRFAGTPPPLLDTRFEASAHLVTSLQTGQKEERGQREGVEQRGGRTDRRENNGGQREDGGQTGGRIMEDRERM